MNPALVLRTAPWTARNRQRPEVVILGVPERKRVQEVLQKLRPAIEAHADIVAIDLEFSYDFTDKQHDLVIVLGGDGSILQAARQMAENQTPVLGVNCGRLGFLAALSPEEFLQVWPGIGEGQFRCVNHLMLRASLLRGDQPVASQLGLNEAAILGGPPYQIMNVAMYVDEALATTYRCDGLIISTPVGSTSHSMSAGGPILHKDLDAFVVCPISPHTLTFRPVVDSGDRVFELRVEAPNPSTSIVVDGRVLGTIEPGDRVLVRRASQAFQMLQVPGKNGYRTLREKLGWGGNALPSV